MSSVDSEAKSGTLLMEFSFGNPEVVLKAAASSEEVFCSRGRFLSVPGLSADLPHNSMALIANTAKVSVPRESGLQEFLEEISCGRPFPETSVRVMMLERDLSGNSVLWHLFYGKSLRARRNPSGKPNVIQLEVGDLKTFLGKTAGIPQTPECEYQFGEQNTCQFPIATKTELATVTAIDQTVFTVSGLATHAHPYWEEGSFYFNGVEIKILSWNGNEFTLAQLAPRAWPDLVTLGQLIVTVSPGCNKKVSNCILWHNTVNWGGSGKAMVPYNPLFENPG